MEPARDPFEELTSLYLGEPSPASRPSLSTSPPTRRVRTGPMRITVAVCGQLPVMAGIWVTQYADLEAARSGPTVLVRLDGGRCSFEFLRAEHEPVRFDGEPMHQAAASLVGDVRRWIICVDEQDAAAAVQAGADELVVLSSANRMAVIRAYELLKSGRSLGGDLGDLELGVAIVGSDDAECGRAEAVLADTATRHLGAPVAVVARIPRLDVVEHSLRVPFEESLRGEPATMVSSLRLAATDVAPWTDTSDAEREPSLRLRLDGRDVDADLEDELEAFQDDVSDLEMEVDPELLDLRAFFDSDSEHDVEDSEPATRSKRPIDRGRQRPRTPSPIRLGPSPSQPTDRPAFIDLAELDVHGADAASRVGPGRGDAVEAPTSSPTPISEIEPKPIASDLVAAVSGLTAIDWPFVAAEGVQSAIDVDGRLHLVCRDVDHGQLDIASAWAASHARQMARCAGITEDAVRTPVLHVVTDHAPRIANLHRTGLHLHLIVETAGSRITVPLNDEGNREMR